MDKALVAARTLIVGPGGYPTITAAVAESREGDTVLVRPGIYEGRIVVEGKSIAIRGDGARDDIVIAWDQAPALCLFGTDSTVAGLTIVGGDEFPDTGSRYAVWVSGGRPRLMDLRVTERSGIAFEEGAIGRIHGCMIDDVKSEGILACGGASPRIEGNDIWAYVQDGITVRGAGTEPIIRANRVHDSGYSAVGIGVRGGASPQIEDNDIWGVTHGIVIKNVGTEPVVRGNRIHDTLSHGILVADRASPQIEENELWVNGSGIEFLGAGTGGLVRANLVHEARTNGVLVWGGASPCIEDNEVWANLLFGIEIRDVGTEPIVRANHLHDGHHFGIKVRGGASPRIEDNRIEDNAYAGIEVCDAGSDPLLLRNLIRRNGYRSIVFRDGGTATMEDNHVDQAPVWR
jgi:parallel beta-helix repeat protein